MYKFGCGGGGGGGEPRVGGWREKKLEGCFVLGVVTLL
jgi:hypothetical protein